MDRIHDWKAEDVKVDPVRESGLPSVVLDIDVEPKRVVVGEKVNVAVTIINQGDHPALALKATLRFPNARVDIEEPPRSDREGEWYWTVDRLDGAESEVLHALVTLAERPPGGAFLAQVNVSGAGVQALEDTGGAIVIDRHSPAQARVLDGDHTIVHMDHGQVEVRAPAKVAITFARPASEDHPGSRGEPELPSIAGFKSGLETVVIEATDSDGRTVGQFDSPGTLVHRYTLEQLKALGIEENDLALFRYDDKEREWIPLSTHVDTSAQTATAEIPSGGPYQLSDGSSPSEAFIPSLRGWQVAMSMGTVVFHYPIDVPAGPGGIRPELALTYSSGATDGRSGRRPKTQSSWVGKGWSLDTGSIAMYKTRVYSQERLRFALMLGGLAADLVRSDPLVANPSPTNPTHWEWRSANESFIRARVLDAGPPTSDRGGFQSGNPFPRYLWHVWTKDGTRYEFAEDLWWGWNDCVGGEGDYAYMETYRWRLSRTVDTHGNVANYAYGRLWSSRPETCFHVRGTVDLDCWPTEITWGGNLNTDASDRYRVEFVSDWRQRDKLFDYADNQYGANNGAPRETRKLLAVKVWSRPADTWELVRQYNFDSDYRLYSDARIRRPDGTYGPDPAYPKLTLNGVTRVASDGATPLPPLRFTYLEGDGGGDQYAVGGWQRLSQVDNGQGGSMRFTYENIGATMTPRNGLFINQHRVTARTVLSGPEGSSFGHAYTWRYTYGMASYNSLGTSLGGGGTKPNPNSAELYYNKYWDTLHDNTGWLVHPPLTEFRGHDYVKEVGPDGAQIEHWFHTGEISDDPSCPRGYPADSNGHPVSGPRMLDDPCFKRLRDQEFLKGREYRTQVRTSIGALVTSIDRRFGVEFYGYTDTPLSGGWRAFPYEAETVESAFEGSNTPVRMIKNYQYEPAKQGGRQYGNVTRFEQRDQTGALYRVKDYFYAARDDPAGYLVDRRWQEAIRDGRGNLLGITQYFYDGLDTSPASLGTEGKLTRVSRYYDVPPQPSSQGITLHGIDTTYRHDAYGNVVAVTTYDEPSTRLWSGGNSFSIGPPGNGTAGSATSTTYDPTLHVYPIEVRKPLGLVTKTDYDYRIGTVKRVTDANGASTIAEYDLFGRMTKLIKSGDTLAAPTVQTFYLDWEQPFRYVFAQRERSGQAANRPTQRFYDGLGRELQTKSESKEATQNIVVDKMYDAFDRVVRESQPRYVDEAPDAGSPGSSFWRYTVPDGSVRWTTTEYDSVGRAVRVTQADGAATNHRYEVHQDAPGVWMVVDDVLDANRHRTQYAFDAFGRLVKVHELSGECGTYGGVSYPCGPGQENWGIKSQTRYSYDPRDLLTKVVDGKGNETTMAYDGVGRKTAMVDPDMGPWSYAYDPAGSLVRQTDAMGRVLHIEYDALDRLTAKLVETWRDDFSDGVLTGWSPRGNAAESGGFATVTGTGSDWTSGIFRQSVALDKQGVTSTFRVSDPAGGAANMGLHSGTYGQPDYRRWGVVVADGNVQLTVWVGTNQKATSLMPARANSPYRLSLVADGQDGFRVSVEDLGNPGRRASLREGHADWVGRSWNFFAQVRTGTLTLEDYQEVDQSAYAYDQGVNGKERRTSMSSPAATTAWKYDARGRIIEATHSVAALAEPRTFSWSYDSADRVTMLTYPSQAGGGSRESVSYSYDAAWRPVRLRSDTFGLFYVGSDTEGVTYTPLGQPEKMLFASGVTQDWSYVPPTQRLARLVLRGPANQLLDRSYAYDGVGNVSDIRDNQNTGNNQRFTYDHRDQVLSWRLGAAAPVTYAYDGIGNVISKAGASYDYAPQTPWNGGPHAVKAVDGQPYRYDRIGNLSSGGGRRYSWNSENLPTTVTGRDGVTETYGYNADSERVTRTRSGVATIYAEGLWEETVGGRAKSFYSFHGHIVAVREGSTVTSLHGDHLGSISVATTSTAGGPQAPSQEFDTWGRVRSGGINQTSLNYTGHPLDLTGLLNAGARLYDPELARFVSADTVVPAIGGCCCSSTGGLENPNGRKSLAVKQGKGHARSPGGRGATSLGSDSGADDNHRTGALIQDASVLVEKGVIAAKCGPSTIVSIDEGGRALRPLTVAFYEPDLLAASNAENGTVLREGFRFDGQGTDPLQGPLSMALLIPQALNRYEYALNNPLRHVDPTGHSLCGLFVEAACVAGAAAICVAVGALCTLGTIISVGGLLLPCTGVVMASCGLAAWDAVMCTAVLTQEICGERIFGAPASGSPASGGGVGGSW